jgi:Tfp pilus assembly protein PilF|uniref:Uncharacterized protein n=1 Tax=Leptospirillum ferrodiazotrophum TaxID=412449 RepID=C6HVA8_9BACT|nr:MAG: conserved hypothetical protein [Leptospirillum ferrodiazotrophum]
MKKSNVCGLKKGIAKMAVFSLLVVGFQGCANMKTSEEQAYLAEQEGYADYRHGDLPGAEKDYREALKNDPSSLRFRRNLAVVLYREGKKAESLQLFDTVLLPGEKGERHFRLARANAYLHEHDYRRAQNDLQKILIEGRWPKGFRLVEAYSDIRTGSYREASIVLHEVLSERPDDPVALGYQSIVYRQMGEAGRARKTFLSACLAGRSKQFRKSLERIYQACDSARRLH